MKQLRVYIDTSVVGGCFDDEFASASLALFKKVAQGEIEIIISDLLLEELIGAPQRVKDHFDVFLEQVGPSIPITQEARQLRDAYVSHGVVGSASMNDALHIAAATISGVDVIASWNFKHMVHLEKIRGFNAVNQLMGYDTVEIRSPRELV